MADSQSIQGGTAASETITGTAGTDLIYGQGGADTLIGGDGNDGLYSGEYLVGPTNALQPDYMGDRLDGGNGNDLLEGGSGSDFLIGGAGTNDLRGGGGYDTAIYAGTRGDYTVAMRNGFPAAVTSPTGPTDTLSSVERLSFSDVSIAFDIDGNAGNIYRLYRAAFDRQPDDAGLGYWISVADKNVSNTFIASELMTSPEFTAKYGANLSDEQFLTQVYKNVLDRDFDQAGFNYWLDVMQDQHVSRADVLYLIAQDTENRAAVIGDIQNGIEYTLYTG